MPLGDKFVTDEQLAALLASMERERLMGAQVPLTPQGLGSASGSVLPAV